jgi:quercetin dioxygenase-like cupin family protein
MKNAPSHSRAAEKFAHIHAASLMDQPPRGRRGELRQKTSETKEHHMDYTFFPNLQQEFTIPEKGILSRVLHKDEKVNVTLFGFAAGEELSAHSAPTPAVLYFLEGEAELQLGTDKVQAEAGSFVYMPPMLSHGISAKTGLRMLLVQMKELS